MHLKRGGDGNDDEWFHSCKCKFLYQKEGGLLLARPDLARSLAVVHFFLCL